MTHYLHWALVKIGLAMDQWCNFLAGKIFDLIQLSLYFYTLHYSMSDALKTDLKRIKIYEAFLGKPLFTKQSKIRVSVPFFSVRLLNYFKKVIKCFDLNLSQIEFVVSRIGIKSERLRFLWMRDYNSSHGELNMFNSSKVVSPYVTCLILGVPDVISPWRVRILTFGPQSSWNRRTGH